MNAKGDCVVRSMLATSSWYKTDYEMGISTIIYVDADGGLTSSRDEAVRMIEMKTFVQSDDCEWSPVYWLTAEQVVSERCKGTGFVELEEEGTSGGVSVDFNTATKEALMADHCNMFDLVGALLFDFVPTIRWWASWEGWCDEAAHPFDWGDD